MHLCFSMDVVYVIFNYLKCVIEFLFQESTHTVFPFRKTPQMPVIRGMQTWVKCKFWFFVHWLTSCFRFCTFVSNCQDLDLSPKGTNIGQCCMTFTAFMTEGSLACNCVKTRNLDILHHFQNVCPFSLFFKKKNKEVLRTNCISEYKGLMTSTLYCIRLFIFVPQIIKKYH